MQVKRNKEIQRVVPLEVGLEDLLAGGLEAQLTFDLYFDFLARDKIFFSRTICINFHL